MEYSCARAYVVEGNIVTRIGIVETHHENDISIYVWRDDVLGGGISPGFTPMVPVRSREATLLSMFLLMTSINIGKPNPCIWKMLSSFRKKIDLIGASMVVSE